MNLMIQSDSDAPPSFRHVFKAFFYPRWGSMLAFTLLAIVGINFFVDAADNEFDVTNPFSNLGLVIGAPLYLILSSFIYSLFPGWSWAFTNPNFGWVMIPLVFGYLYFFAVSIAHLWRWLAR